MVLSKLTDLKFIVNVKKCVFAKTQIKYLGHIIGDGRHEPDPEKLRAIEIIETPKTKNYIQNYAEIAKPLTDLTKKKVPELIPWTDVEELSFQKLKKKLIEAPSLYTPDPKKPLAPFDFKHEQDNNHCVSVQQMDAKST
nr:uncharacterized mitochondrial protein AtMg00860-like [Parasteatoda tepidariorum]